VARSDSEQAARGDGPRESPSLFVWALPAALLAAVALQVNQAHHAVPRTPSPARTVPELERTSSLALPNCIAAENRAGLSERGRFGFDHDMRRTLSVDSDGRTLLSEAVFSWVPETGELRPVNAAARRIADFRTACR
jgi:hypothetical protein